MKGRSSLLGRLESAYPMPTPNSVGEFQLFDRECAADPTHQHKCPNIKNGVARVRGNSDYNHLCGVQDGILRDVYRAAVKNRTDLDFTCQDSTEADNLGMPFASSTNNDSLDITPVSFSVPEKVQEDSMEENITTNSLPREEESSIMFKVLDCGTQRGKRKLVVVVMAFTFAVKPQNRHYTNWQCSVRKKNLTYCPVTVRQTADECEQIDGQNTHLGMPGTLKSLEMQKTVTDVAILETYHCHCPFALKLEDNID